MSDEGYPMLVFGGWSTANCENDWSVEDQTSSHGLLIEDDVSDLGVCAGNR